MCTKVYDVDFSFVYIFIHFIPHQLVILTFFKVEHFMKLFPVYFIQLIISSNKDSFYCDLLTVLYKQLFFHTESFSRTLLQSDSNTFSPVVSF